MKMQNKIEQAFEQADNLIKITRNQLEPQSITQVPSNIKCLKQRLLDFYIKESKKQKESNITCLQLRSNLLDQLMKKEHLNTLVLNLYSDYKGYSLSLKGKNEVLSETFRLPYEEYELLEYIDNEQLPPILVDLLERAPTNIFHSGCVIVEIKDYRRSNDGSFDTRYTILQPSLQSLQSDINMITNDGYYWLTKDRISLESQLLIATQERLCLDPSPAVFIATNRLHYERKQFNTKLIQRYVKKNSQCTINRRRKYQKYSSPKSLALHDFLSKRKDKPRKNVPINLKSIDAWKTKSVQLSPPSSVDVTKHAFSIKSQELTTDNTPVIVEEYIMECERGQSKIYQTHLILQQRGSDHFYLGELHVNKDFKKGNLGRCCSFPLGTELNTKKYVDQFTEIFTEEGRRSVKITHIIPGQEPEITYTHAPSASTTPSDTSNTQGIVSQTISLASDIITESNDEQPINSSTSFSESSSQNSMKLCVLGRPLVPSTTNS